MKDCFDEQRPKPPINYFNKTKHNTNIQLALRQETVLVPNICTDTYRENSVKYPSTQTWNELQHKLHLDLLDQSRPKAKIVLLNIS